MKKLLSIYGKVPDSDFHDLLFYMMEFSVRELMLQTKNESANLIIDVRNIKV